MKGNSNNILFEKYILYGAINIYNSKIQMQNFEINEFFLKPSHIKVKSFIKNGVIKNISSDAIDVDNGEGRYKWFGNNKY